MYVPIIGYFDGLDAALEVDIDFDSKFNPIEGNGAEGVVIRPFKKNYYFMHDKCIIKKKSEKFKEKASSKKGGSGGGLKGELLEISNEICSYVTENRLMNVISHMGEPDGMQQFGEYIKEFIRDVHEDVRGDMKERLDKLEKVDKKKVFKDSGKKAAAMLRNYFMKG